MGHLPPVFLAFRLMPMRVEGCVTFQNFKVNDAADNNINNNRYFQNTNSHSSSFEPNTCGDKKEKMENLIKDFYCEICSLQFGNGIVFDMHQSIVHGIVTKVKQEPVISENKTKAEKKIIQCSICEAIFASGRNLKMHFDSIRG